MKQSENRSLKPIPERGITQLVCFTCKKESPVAGPKPISAMDIIEATKIVGWKAVQDPGRYRVLVFCTDLCIEFATTKRGTLRLRMPERKV